MAPFFVDCQNDDCPHPPKPVATRWEAKHRKYCSHRCALIVRWRYTVRRVYRLRCANPSCRRLFVAKPYRVRRFCSKRCNGLMLGIHRRGQLPAAIARSTETRRRNAAARVRGLTPLAAYRCGYIAGSRAALAKLQHRYTLAPKQVEGAEAPGPARARGEENERDAHTWTVESWSRR